MVCTLALGMQSQQLVSFSHDMCKCMHATYLPVCQIQSASQQPINLDMHLLILGSHMQPSWVRRRQTRSPEAQACTLFCFRCWSSSRVQAMINSFLRQCRQGLVMHESSTLRVKRVQQGRHFCAQSKHPSLPAYIIPQPEHAISLLVPTSTA